MGAQFHLSILATYVRFRMTYSARVERYRTYGRARWSFYTASAMSCPHVTQNPRRRADIPGPLPATCGSTLISTRSASDHRHVASGNRNGVSDGQSGGDDAGCIGGPIYGGPARGLFSVVRVTEVSAFGPLRADLARLPLTGCELGRCATDRATRTLLSPPDSARARRRAGDFAHV